MRIGPYKKPNFRKNSDSAVFHLYGSTALGLASGINLPVTCNILFFFYGPAKSSAFLKTDVEKERVSFFCIIAWKKTLLFATRNLPATLEPRNKEIVVVNKAPLLYYNYKSARNFRFAMILFMRFLTVPIFSASRCDMLFYSTKI